MKLDFIIPALNEGEGIAKVLNEFPDEEIEEMGFEIRKVVVDGGSEDDTQEKAKENGAEVIVEERPGYGRAYKTGFSNSDADIIVTCDADTTYSLEKVPELVKEVMDGADFISTNRLNSMSKGSMAVKNRLGNEVLNLFSKTLFLSPFRDSQSGMWVFRREILDEIDVNSDGMPFSEEIKLEAHLNNLKVQEHDIKYSTRQGVKELHPWSDGFQNLKFLFEKKWQSLKK